jgi:hypothetical protein
VADPAWFGLIDFNVLLLEKPGGSRATRLPFVLAQRAVADSPRWTRAVKDNLVTLLREDKGE